ncbi:pectinesterase family protein [Saccharicrinis sp. FJH54]|uniref:pectinesterase family protein n=1 Tax=Saccharicrinis sp. FJH54 TaxID=3344665 RepID=UPI0035D50D54
MRLKFYFAVLFSILLFQAVSAQTVNTTSTIAWPHNTADDPLATYSDNTADYFKQDYVSLGSNLHYKGVRTSNGVTFRTYQPNAQTGTGPENAISFNIKPVTGLTFVPTSISFKAQRYGTDGGFIDVVWKSTNGTETVLATDIKPDRDNSGSYTDYFYSLPEHSVNVTGSDAECSLILILHDLGNTKEAGFADVTVVGNISGTVANVTTYTLTTSVLPDGAGEVSTSPVGDEFDEGTEVTLTASKNFGYKFSHWADASDQQVSTANPYTVTMNANTVLKAVYNAVNTYSLTVTPDGGANDYMISYLPEGNMIDNKRMYEDGTNVTITASGNPVLTFTNWDNGETGTDLTVNMNEDKSITAYYSAVDYIVGWDFYLPGNSGRVADFYSTDDNQSASLILRDAAGNTTSWLDKSTVAAGGYEAADGAAVNWNNLADKYYYQISFNAADFTDIKVSADMLYNYNVYSVQRCEYSLDGTSFTLLGTYTLNAAKALFPGEFSLPADANNAGMVYIRWIPDYTSDVVGSSTEKDGTCISAIYVTGTEAIVDDGTAPVLVNSVPSDGATGASASGKVVLTFDEKVKIAENTTGLVGQKTLIPAVSGKTITFPYTGLDYNTEYTFTLAGGVISDLTDNTISDPISITFTTLDKPMVSKKVYDFIVGMDGDFAAALSAAQAASSSGNRFYIFFPDGDYNIGELTGDGNEMTTISIPNVSYIGESTDGVILHNNPASEGIGTTATIYFTSSSSNIYMQDITLQNDYDYTGSTGRAVALRDQGDKNIYKNVRLLSFQDTYYTGDDRSYWENGEIHGTVDFICGGGDIFFNECLLYLEDRSGNCLTAPASNGDWGYVFSNCTIDGYPSNKGSYRLGRPWSNAPKAVYINTTMKVLPTAEAWGDPMNVVPAVFAEYNSMTESGSAVDLSNRRTTYTKDATTVVLDPVLTSAEAATYTVDNVVGGNDAWQPKINTEQAPIPVITIEGNTISWDNSDYVLGWAVIKDGQFVDFITSNSYTVPVDATSGTTYSIRAANEMGGLSTASNAVVYNATAIELNKADRKISGYRYYSVNGKPIRNMKEAKGVIIIQTLYDDGSITTQKVVRLKKD